MNDRTLASVSDTPDTLPLFSSCFRLRLRVPLSRAAVLCGIETLASDVAVDCVTLVGMGHWRSGGAVIAEPVAVVEALCPTEAKAWHLLREHANDSADRYATAIREMQATAKCRREEAARLRDLADAADNRADRLSRFLVECMDRIGVPRLEGQLFTLRVQRNGGSQPVDVLVAPEELPDRFREVTVTVRPDKDAIRKALEAGDEEARKVACLMERGRSLRIG